MESAGFVSEGLDPLLASLRKRRTEPVRDAAMTKVSDLPRSDSFPGDQNQPASIYSVGHQFLADANASSEYYTLGNDRPETFIKRISPDEPERNVDVVLVHGLSGDYVTTWTRGDFFWPEQLVKSLPHARVLLFQYDVNVWMQSSASRIEDVARDLLDLLGKSRMQRSIASTVWIAHSLGGFIVKKAFLMEREPSPEIRLEPRDPTEDFIFLSTPHRALSIRGWDRIFTSIQEVSREYSEDAKAGRLVEHPDSSKIRRLLYDFEDDISNFTPTPKIMSCFEKHEASNQSIPVLVTSSGNASLSANERVHYLSGNHVTISKFFGVQDEGYQLIWNFLTRSTPFLDPLDPESSSDYSIPRSNFERDIEQELFEFKESSEGSPHPTEDLKTAVPSSVIKQFASSVKLRRVMRMLSAPLNQAHQGHSAIPANQFLPCDYLFPELPPQVTTWLESNDKPLLLVSGGFGAGKTTLLSQIVDHLEMRPDEYPIVLSYFYHETASDEEAALEMISQFLLQLLEVMPLLIRHFPIEQVFRRRRHRWPVSDILLQPESKLRSITALLTQTSPIWEDGATGEAESRASQTKSALTLFELVEILISMLHDDTLAYSCIFVIDGMHELVYSIESSDNKTPRLDQIKYIIASLLNSPQVKVCLSCYEHSSIHVDCPSEHLDLGETLRDSDISNMLQNIDSVVPTNLLNLPNFEEELTQLEQRLIGTNSWSRLWQGMTKTIVRELCEKDDVSSLQDLIKRLNGPSYSSTTYAIVQVCAWVIRSLNIERGLDYYILAYTSLANRALSIEELTVLLNQSVIQDGWPLPGWVKDSSMSQKKSLIANAISTRLYGLLKVRGNIMVMSFPSTKGLFRRAFENLGYSGYRELHHQIGLACLATIRQAAIQEDVDSLYANKNWDKHLKISQQTSSVKKTVIWPSPLDKSTLEAIENTIRTEGHSMWSHQRQFLPLNDGSPISIFNVLAAFDLEGLLSRELEAQKPYEGKRIEAAMQCAAVNNASEALDVLQKWDLGGESNLGETTRKCIAFGKTVFFADFLLPSSDQYWRDLPQNLDKDSYSELLDKAVITGNVTLLQKLLKVDNETVYELLVRSDRTRSSALHIAAKIGFSEVVELLLQSGARKRVFDMDKRFPIHLAAARAHNKVVQFLVSSDVDLDAEERTPLFDACESKSMSTIRLLLDLGLNINHKDRRGWTPLHVATRSGAAETVRLLINGGADVQVTCPRLISPLHLAAFGSWLPATVELLSAQVPVDIIDERNQTPLHYACKSPNPSVDVVRLLLDAGANASARDLKRQTPLHVACKRASVETVRLLLECRQDPQTTDGRDRSPLEIAKWHKNDSVIKLLEDVDSMANSHPDMDISVTLLLQKQRFVERIEPQHCNSWVIFVSGLYPMLGVDLKESSLHSNMLFWTHEFGISDFLQRSRLSNLAQSFLYGVRKHISRESNVSSSSTSNTSPQSGLKSIVFVAHGIGGILLKEILNVASQREEFAHILQYTRGIVFVGTPHGPAGLQNTSDIVKALFDSPSNPKSSMGDTVAFKRLYERNYSLSLRQSDDLLSKISRDFDRMFKDRLLNILSVVESLSTKIGQILVPAASAVYRDSDTIQCIHASNADLSQLQKLPEFPQILSFIQNCLNSNKVAQDAHHHSQKSSVVPKSKQRPNSPSPIQNIIKMLQPDVLENEKMHFNLNNFVDSSLLPSQQQNRNLLTGEQAAVKKWSEDAGTRCLWIMTNVGSGKTIFLQQLIKECQTNEELKKNQPFSNSVYAWFFFSRQQHPQTTVIMLRSILAQILGQSPMIAEKLLASEMNQDLLQAQFAQSPERLCDVISQVIEATPDSLFWIFLDSLDKCESNLSIARSATGSLSGVVMLVERVLPYPNIKLCVSSRPLPMFHNFPRRWDATVISRELYGQEEIRQLVEKTLRSSLDDSQDLESMSKTSQMIAQRSNGMLLWAKLAAAKVAELEMGGATKSERDAIIASFLPQELEDLYSNMIAEIPRQSLSKTKDSLRILLLANPPVDLAILYWATRGYKQDNAGTDGNTLASDLVAVNDNDPGSGRDIAEAHRAAKRQIIPLINNFVTVSEDEHVIFAHQTAEEFATRYTSRDGVTVDVKVHIRLLSACILMMKRLRAGREAGNLTERGDRKQILRYINDGVDYSIKIDSKFPPRTFESASTTAGEFSPSPELLSYARLFQELCTTALNLHETLSKAAPQDTTVSPQNLTPPAVLTASEYASILAARHGLIQYTMLTHLDASLSGKYSNTSLLYRAMLPDHLEMPWGEIPVKWDLPDPQLVEYLLKNGANPNEIQYSTSLWHIVLEYGYHCFSKDLVPCRLGPTPSLDNRKRWLAIVKLFLDHGANVVAQYPMKVKNRDPSKALPRRDTNSDKDEQTLGAHDEANLATERVVLVTAESALRKNLSGEAQYVVRLSQLLNQIRTMKREVSIFRASILFFVFFSIFPIASFYFLWVLRIFIGS